jgi:phosphomannomutase
MIKFGTDGWRAIMAEEFTFANVEIVAQGIANYLKEENLAEKGIVIGYDNRFLAEEFAVRVGEVMAGNGIPVFITAKPSPTPVTAYAILLQQAAGAVMLTASHNPAQYNGIKFIPQYAGPAIPAITEQIENHLKNLLRESGVKKTEREQAVQLGMWKEISPEQEYLAALAKLINIPTIKKAELTIVVDPMYGAGIGYMEDFFQESCKIHSLRSYRDPFFGGGLPEPTENNLQELREQVLTAQADLGLALDGDADRFGIIDTDGSYINPNQVLVLLYHHLLVNKGIKGPVARTVATTHLLDKMAKKYGYRAEETPVGFKYIGQMIREKGCILGGEESGGLSISGHIPEKDGILAAALITELRALSGKPLLSTLQEIEAEFGALYSQRLDLRTTSEDKNRILRDLETYYPDKLGGIAVVGKLSIDGLKLLLADDSWCLIRPSGTEPLFRIYVEAKDRKVLKQIQTDIKQDLKL